ncbi:uncharacterized protein LOC128556557 [Mercenaria mercenaria]|uniref:uncharacterized protein LOC128556557 n=1 Tax=Mercenaria mercenaria TaxID=6596 RepID=UPI00234FB18F|nr:uncharacterized protein LOC128556557 [Mercenaria mercenaria]
MQIWIGNKRGKEKRKGESSVTKNKKSYRYTSGPNAFSLFLSKMKRGNEDKAAFFTKAAAKWRLLPENEKQPIQEEAAKLRQDPMKGMSREKLIHTELAIMSKCCDRLSSFGFHFGGIGVDTTEKCPPVVVGSHLGVQFMNKPELQAQYTRHFIVALFLSSLLAEAKT